MSKRSPQPVTFSPSGARKMALDEESFQQLLAAAYTLQENKDVLRPGNSEHDSASVFSEIAALRSRIFAASNPANAVTKPRDAVQAAILVARCARQLTNADGASVCLIIDGYLKCAAYAGTAVKVPGGSVASNSLVATERLRNGRAFLSANACSDIRLEPSLCVKLKIGSLLAVPITVKNDVAGLIELRWNKAEAFGEGDERICQLLVDLMSEVLNGEAVQVNAPVTLPVQAVAPRPVISPKNPSVPQPETEQAEVSSVPVVGDAPLEAGANTCRVCGRPLDLDLNFCGNCGMLAGPPAEDMQSKWASMWFMQQAQKAVEPRQNRSERLWPLEGANVTTAKSSSEDMGNDESENADADDADGVSAGSRRGPRGVLRVLRAQLKARGGERKLPPS